MHWSLGENVAKSDIADGMVAVACTLGGPAAARKDVELARYGMLFDRLLNTGRSLIARCWWKEFCAECISALRRLHLCWEQGARFGRTTLSNTVPLGVCGIVAWSIQTTLVPGSTVATVPRTLVVVERSLLSIARWLRMAPIPSLAPPRNPVTPDYAA